MKKILNKLRNGLIVSCQAFENEPLYGSEIMAKMAKSADIGGAVGLRACWPQDIRAIKKVTNLPIVGINKVVTKDTDLIEDIIITPTFEAAKSIYEAGADIIALDCTNRKREGLSVKELIYKIKNELNVLVMADISNLEEGINAAKYGADIISTTLSGYTKYSPQIKKPDYRLLEELVDKIDKPINAEGRYWSPEEMIKAFEKGAWMITIGGAITRPHLITKRFSDALKSYKESL
ncbi:N-acetylmannosamine-6-phosphate 2-epimerase [Maledivibacter halophilus]|uniref:Putative N-acetylmannosamine-6-phosphate 2-epimerase n=1 Tax=Maledivibacter halophilus TaxID=36842 RepID=A0A1T5I979_9FIRM|nr:N-acetylmannosamine-6-phosphate 2-epimerase [Maledivibacter halophilus]SKC35737.1 N-acylglucosamine-6-phosphate 2-epimerase [Maledivibacter halophilus]